MLRLQNLADSSRGLRGSSVLSALSSQRQSQLSSESSDESASQALFSVENVANSGSLHTAVVVHGVYGHTLLVLDALEAEKDLNSQQESAVLKYVGIEEVNPHQQALPAVPMLVSAHRDAIVYLSILS